jgi:hypothetical protein
MTEPVTNAQIEDVLSSIRRLVSDEVRKEVPLAEAVEPEKPAAATRLVLTPALRVADTDEDEPGAAERPDAGAHVNDGDIAELPEDTPWEEPGATLYEAAGVKVVEITDEGEEALSDEESAAEDIADTDADETDDELPFFVHHVDPASDATDAADPDSAEADRESGEFTARIAAVEAVVAGLEDQWEPDGTGGDDYAGHPVETLPWQDFSEADKDPDPAPEAESFVEQDAVPVEEAEAAPDVAASGDATPDDLDVLSSDETYLDEESLRELVADIVRQELQGALGERITRNVRKLVRREIHRALVAQDLE